MENINLDLGGFDAVFSGLSGKDGIKENDYDIIDPKKITGENDDDQKDLDDVNKDKNNEDDDTSGTDDTSDNNSSSDRDSDGDDDDNHGNDDVDDGDKDDKGSSKTTLDSDKDEITDFGEYEEDIADFVQEKLFQEFGWEKNDESFKSMEEVVDFIKDVIEENKTPDYSTEDVRKMDDYVRSGGNLNDYMEEVHGGLNLDTVSIERESDQKALVRENLKLKGYSEARIKKAVDRYEDAGTLKEEAEDAEELVRDYNTKIADKLLEDQKNVQADMRQRQQKYYEDVETEIKGLENVRGIEISASEKRKLVEYIFKPTSTGKTQYQSDYIKNQKNLIESAYFTMKGDKFVQKVQKKASSDATKRLRKKLESKGKRGKDQNIQSSSTYSFLDSAYSQLKKPKY